MTADILTRLQQVSGPDRKIDAEIAAFVRWHPYGPEHWINRSPEASFSVLSDGRVNFSLPDETEPRGGWVVPSFTDSIDASLALVERMLPGKWTDILRQALWLMNKAFDWHICLKKPEQRNLLPVYILIALFTALQETDNDHG